MTPEPSVGLGQPSHSAHNGSAAETRFGFSPQLTKPISFGFRNNISTDDALINVTGKIINELDTGNKCLGIFLDLRKAFDTINHNLLLDKLHTIGVRATDTQILRRKSQIGFHYLLIFKLILFHTYKQNKRRQDQQQPVLMMANSRPKHVNKLGLAFQELDEERVLALRLDLAHCAPNSVYVMIVQVRQMVWVTFVNPMLTGGLSCLRPDRARSQIRRVPDKHQCPVSGA
ncbi:hypothetical protein ANN_04224 [Periplaneta americana]|uniref:Reverse transcriptase domain-containing protein n=1 Tax=Periplaneta americana TaxID=6978 RepID=A0ABQ8TAD9_PERAM|nr:hypothetical protein ANN_04224 [Periplaneta americana]